VVTRVPLNRRTIPPDIIGKAMHALYRVRVPRAKAERAWKSWRAGGPLTPCKYGKEQAIAADCTCEGCIEKLCWFYFDQVSTKFGVDA
jgi:hypothetical protein